MSRLPIFWRKKVPPDFILADEAAANGVGAGCQRREIYENKGIFGENKYLMLASLRLLHAVANEHLDDPRDTVGFGQAGMAPSGGVVVTQDVHFSERGVGVGEAGLQANGFEEQSEGFLRLKGDAV